MTIAQLIHLGILLSIMLIVLSFGMLCTWRDATSLFRNPSLLLRSLLSMNVILPVFIAVLVGLFAFRAPISIMLLALAVSPVPPFLPLKQRKLVGHHDYIYGLLGASSLLVIVLAPLTVAVFGMIFEHETKIEPLGIAKMVALTVLLPFALGLVLHHRAPAFSDRASPIANKLGIGLLLLVFLPVVVKSWPQVISLIGDGTVLAIIAFVLVGLAAGHLLGGPVEADRTILALSTATRHPGVALVIVTAMRPDDKLIGPALIIYLLVSAIVSAPYGAWRKRAHKPG
jgi:bile acid:Na+ symporter, BASS family